MVERASVSKGGKGARTRERLLDVALDLFAAKGYEATTMRDIAAGADCALGLTYRYFAGKEELVLALYERLAGELEAQAEQASPGPLGDRFAWVMQAKLALLAPYRDAFGALAGAALTPGSRVAVLGARSADVRRRVRRVFHRAAAGAAGAPREPITGHLATVLYVAHLAVLLVWLHDRTPDGRVTREFIALARDTLGLVRPVLALPPVAGALARLAGAFDALLALGDGDVQSADWEYNR